MAEEPARAPAPVIVERDRELDVIRSALAAGRQGSPSVVVLSGEPGIGKSHLLRSLRPDYGEVLLRGYSLEADAPPYFPLRRAFARLDRDDRLRESPAVSVLRSAGILQSGEAGGGPAPDRLAVLDALSEFLIELSAGAPVILCLDDMQWASAAMWEAVTYLARALDGARVTIVLGTRPEGIEPPRPGAATLAELNRNRLLHLLHPRPLSPAGISGLVSYSAGAAPAPAFVSLLAARTGGNPFFLEEVLRSLSEAGQLVAAPEGLTVFRRHWRVSSRAGYPAARNLAACVTAPRGLRRGAAGGGSPRPHVRYHRPRRDARATRGVGGRAPQTGSARGHRRRRHSHSLDVRPRHASRRHRR